MDWSVGVWNHKLVFAALKHSHNCFCVSSFTWVSGCVGFNKESDFSLSFWTNPEHASVVEFSITIHEHVRSAITLIIFVVQSVVLQESVEDWRCFVFLPNKFICVDMASIITVINYSLVLPKCCIALSVVEVSCRWKIVVPICSATLSEVH